MPKVYEQCVVCGSSIPLPARKFKNTCCDDCHAIKIKQIDRRAYAGKMARDPQFAAKQSRRQYERIKSDPDKWEEFKQVRDARYQMPNYRASLRKSWRKYNQKNKEERLEQTRQRRAAQGAEWTKRQLEYERRRAAKRSKQRAWLKENDPVAYQQLLEKERKYSRRLNKRKRLQNTQSDFYALFEALDENSSTTTTKDDSNE